jgi:uncharacterized protein (DUF885 family)
MNLLACVLLLAAAPGTDDARFEAFAQKYVQELLDREPETATRLGEHRNDARLNDYSAQGVERDLSAAKGGLAELARIDVKKLSADDAVDYRILRSTTCRRCATGNGTRSITTSAARSTR